MHCHTESRVHLAAVARGQHCSQLEWPMKAWLRGFHFTLADLGRHKIVSGLILEYHELLNLIWIKGLMRNCWNEVADALTTKGLTTSVVGSESIMPLALAKLNTTLMSSIEGNHFYRWLIMKHCRYSSAALPAPSHKLTKYSKDQIWNNALLWWFISDTVT